MKDIEDVMPEPMSTEAVKKLLLELLNQAVDNKILSIMVIGETTSGTFFTARTPPENIYGRAGYTIAAATDDMMETFYDGVVEECDDPADLDMDEDE
jgi:hypothetical protein